MNWVLGRMARRRNTEYEVWGEMGVVGQGQNRDLAVIPAPRSCGYKLELRGQGKAHAEPVQRVMAG